MSDEININTDGLVDIIRDALDKEPISTPVGMSMALPMGRETIEVWDPIQKCKVIRYKDELEKELYGHLYKELFGY